MSPRAASLLALAAVAVLAAPLAITPVSSNDIWLHLVTGSLVLDRGAAPRVEEYTFTRAGTPVVDHEWLAQALFAAARRAGGIPALILLKYLLTAAILAVVWMASVAALRSSGAEEDRAPAAAALSLGGASLLLATHLFLRPHLFTLLFAGLFALILQRLRRGRIRFGRALLLLLPLQVLWANLHGGFVVGILLAGIHAGLDLLRSRRAAPSLALPLLLAAAGLVNPYGTGLYELVGAFSDPAFREFIVEWQSPFTAPFFLSALFWVYAAWIAAVIAGAGLALRRGEREAAVTAVLFAALSLTSQRHVSVLAVVSAPLVARAIASIPPGRRAGGWLDRTKHWSPAGFLALGAAIIAAMGVPWPGGGFRRPGTGIGESMPVEALRFMRDEKLEGRVFCTLAFGAYVTYAGWPGLSTYVDSRLEVFGGEFLRRYDRAVKDPEAFRAVEQESPFDLALLSWRLKPSSGAVAALASDPDWSLVYFDDLALLYARRSSPGMQAIVERRGFDVLDPFRYAAGMGFDPAARGEEIVEEARRAIREIPDVPGRRRPDSVARVLLGAALQAEARHEDAVAEFRALLRARPDVVIAWGLLGTSLMEMGDKGGARSAFEELRRRVPGSKFAQRMLDHLAEPEPP